MGRRHSSGAQPLSHADTTILQDLLDECLATRRAINADNGSSPYTKLTSWVERVAIPYFRDKRGGSVEEGKPATTPVEDMQIKTWYKNQCKKHKAIAQRKRVFDEADKAIELANDMFAKLPCVRQLVVDKYKEEIASSVKGPNGEVPPEYLKSWNDALTERLNEMPEDEIRIFESQVEAEIVKRQLPPQREEILAIQCALCPKIAEAVRGLLGWDRKQFGDAVCFMSVAYRNPSNQIQEKNFMISNEESFIDRCRPFTERYNSYMSGHFAAVAQVALPDHDVMAQPSPAEIEAAHHGSTPLALPAINEANVENPAASPPSSSVEPATTPLNGPPLTPTVTDEPASNSPTASSLGPLAEPTTTALNGIPPTLTVTTGPVMNQVASSPSQPSKASFQPPTSSSPPHKAISAAHDHPVHPPLEPPELASTFSHDSNPSIIPQSQGNHTNMSSQPLHLSGVTLPEIRSDATPGQQAPLVVTPSLDLGLNTPPVQEPASLSSSTDTVHTVDPPMISQAPEQIPKAIGKPRQKRGAVGVQAVRASTRPTRAPKRPQPLTNNAQGPRPKVPARERWAYVSEEESLKPSAKKPRRR